MPSEIIFSSTTNMLVIKDGKVLLVKRSDDLADFPGWYILPGGKQERNETPKETAIRETFEETGIQISDADLKVIATHYHEYKSKVYVIFIFSSPNFMGKLVGSKEGTPEWMNIETAVSHPKLYPDLKRHIKLILGSKSAEPIFTYHKFNKDLEITETR